MKRPGDTPEPQLVKKPDSNLFSGGMYVGKKPFCRASVRPTGPCAQRGSREIFLNFAKFRKISRTFPFVEKARRAFPTGAGPGTPRA